MADKPTPTELIERFPEFEGADPEFVQLLIDEAARSVDNTWEVADYKYAVMYLAAHLLASAIAQGAVETDQSASNVTLEEGDDLYIRSVSFGDRTISFGSKKGGLFGEGSSKMSKASLEAALGGTSYGQLFLALLRRNAPRILVI